MTRKLFGTMLAVALAGGVYLAGSPAEASNMGFKLERNFEVVANFPGLYFVSFPLFNGLGDVADSGAAGNPCVGDVGGPAAGDGIVNADDAICDLATDRMGTFNISRYDIASCAFQTRTCTFGGFTSCIGTWVAPLPADEAFQINAPNPMAIGAVNQAVIVGSHNPGYMGRTLALNPACPGSLQLSLINVPYHTMYQNAIEVLCGLEGVDWERRTTDGAPGPVGDPESMVICPNGIWDGAAKITVQTFDNEADSSPTDRQFVPCSVESFFGAPTFAAGTDCFPLVPGEGYQVVMTPGHTATTFLSPHF